MKRQPKRIRTVLVQFYVFYILLALVLVVSVSSWLFGVILNETIRNQARQDMDIAKGEILAYISEVETLLSTVSQNTDIVGYVKWLNRGGESANYSDLEKVHQGLNDMVRYGIGMYALGIYGLDIKDNRYVGSINVRQLYEDMPVDPDYKALARVKNGLIWNSPFHWQYGANTMFCAQRVIIDSEKMTVVGSTSAILESSYLNIILKKTSRLTDSRFYLTEGSALVAACDNGYSDIVADKAVFKALGNKKADLFTGEIGGTGSVIAYETLRNGWKLIILNPTETVSQRLASMRQVMWLICGLVCVMAMLVSLFISKRIARPIFVLADSVQRITLNSDSLQVPNDDTFSETAILSRNINMMLGRINELLFKVYEQQIRERDTHIEMLQAQINPHFLYNTLDVINAKLILEEDYATGTMVMALSDILRYSISGTTHKLHLSEELEYVYKYLYIQKERLGDRLTYQISATEEARNACVLKLLIQPFVENAILHGLSTNRRSGHVLIRAERAGDKLVVQIADNGIGMDQATVDQMLVDESALQQNNSTHVGIRNVYNRIILTYGKENSAVEIHSEPDVGTTVTLKLPYMHDAQS